MSDDRYFLPAAYVPNPAATFDGECGCYWDPVRLSNSLAYQAAVYEWALKLIRAKGIRCFADVGCGSAAKLAKLHQAVSGVEFWGLDQPNSIKLCRSSHDFGNWFPINLERPEQLPDQKFDLIISSDVIEHLENPDILLGVIRRMSHENTLVLLSTPDRVKLRGPHCMSPPHTYHVREWSQHEFATYLRSRQCVILEHRILPAFRLTHNVDFFRRALFRWLHLKTISYNQAVLFRFGPLKQG